MVTARCAGCDWGRRGREAAVLEVTVDGREPQDLVLVRGAESADYAIALGPVAAGKHSVSISLDRKATATGPATWRSSACGWSSFPRETRDTWPPRTRRCSTPAPTRGAIQRRAARCCGTRSIPSRSGQRIRYSVVFSNEDGGTPARPADGDVGAPHRHRVRLRRRAGRGRPRGRPSATRARTIDILPFRGRRLGRHPLLWVVTENNMLAETGKGRHPHRARALPLRSRVGVSRGGDGRAPVDVPGQLGGGAPRGARAGGRRPRSKRSRTRGGSPTSRPART